jgi:ubiquinone/menaquinone biosynthesis C-methylase UbiE
VRALPPQLYDREYFLSDRCEGYEYFREGELSLVKRHEVDLLGVQPGMRVLDAGCGRGEVLLECARRGAAVAGIDYAEAAVELSRETLTGVKGADIRQGEVTDLPWPDGSFDRILFADVLEHLTPGQADRALAEFHRSLGPGGLLLVHTAPNRLFRRVAWPVLRPVMRLAGAGGAADRMSAYMDDVLRYHVNEQSRGSLRGTMRRAGFEDVRAWVDADVLRSGSHRLTRDLESGLVRAGAKVASAWPLRNLLGNDLYATGCKRTS